MTTHLMLDLETLGTRPGAVILAAAFVRFSDEAHVTLNLNIPEQQALGLEIDPATHAWWGDQEAKHPGAWAAATAAPHPIAPALHHFANWINWAGPDPLIWCHGATFDAPLLGELYRRAGIECPWAWWNVRDTRTLYDLAGINNKDYAVPPPHIALNDAIGQTRAANAALQRIGAAMVAANGSKSDRRQTAEIAIGNAECAAQREITDAVLRGALVDNIAAAFI